MGDIGVLLATYVPRGMGSRPLGWVCRSNLVHVRVVVERYARWRGVSLFAYSRLERDHAVCILRGCRLAVGRDPKFTPALGANGGASNGCAAGRDGRAQTIGTCQAAGRAARRDRFHGG